MTERTFKGCYIAPSSFDNLLSTLMTNRAALAQKLMNSRGICKALFQISIKDISESLLGKNAAFIFTSQHIRSSEGKLSKISQVNNTC